VYGKFTFHAVGLYEETTLVEIGYDWQASDVAILFGSEERKSLGR
jgi:hypothetical protein